MAWLCPSSLKTHHWLCSDEGEAVFAQPLPSPDAALSGEVTGPPIRSVSGDTEDALSGGQLPDSQKSGLLQEEHFLELGR